MIAWKSIWQKIHALYAVRSGVRTGARIHIGIGSILFAPGSLVVEDDVYIGKFCTIECDGRIGTHTMIANAVGIIGKLDHDFRVIGKTIRKSPSVRDPDYRVGRPELFVDIGEDVWIGYGAIILSGAKIGRGAIVAAGTVVTKDVSAYDIVACNPARTIGRRFPSEAIIRDHERELLRDFGIPLSLASIEASAECLVEV